MEKEKFGGRHLDKITLAQVLQNLFKLLLSMLVNIRLYFFDEQVKISTIFLLHAALVNDRIERIAHFMRNCGVNQSGEMVLSFQIVVEYLGGDINQLKSMLLYSHRFLSKSLLDLKVHESGQILFLYAFHTHCSKDGLLNLTIILIRLDCLVFDIKGEYLLTYFIL